MSLLPLDAPLSLCFCYYAITLFITISCLRLLLIMPPFRYAYASRYYADILMFSYVFMPLMLRCRYAGAYIN